MFNTPPAAMVKTRSATRKEAIGALDTSQPIVEPQVQTLDKTFNVVDSTSQAEKVSPYLAADTTRAHSRQQSPSHSKAKSVSTTSSIYARRKKLELEAAKEKARIEIEIINKQLEADLAELDENYSPRQSCARSTSHVEEWLDKNDQSQRELHEGQFDHNDGKSPVILHQSATAAGTPASTTRTFASACKDLAAASTKPDYQKANVLRQPNVVTADSMAMLASAIKDLAVASTNNKPNASLLSRISTPSDLPIFSGDPMEWLHFKKAYVESTEVCGFSPAENMWRLRKCLRGAAKEAVSALLISASSPDKLIATLELQFGNADTILYKLMHDIKKLRPVCPEYQSDIVAFSVKIQNFTEAIRALGREEYMQDMTIASIVLSKLPAVLISKWSDYSFILIKSGTKSRLEILSDFLSLEALKISTTANPSLMGIQHPTSHNVTRPHNVLVQAHKQINRNRNAPACDNCRFCKTSAHKLNECKKFKRALRKDRWRHVKRHNICFKCLLGDHEADTCTAPVCDIENCGGEHHRLLHYSRNANENRPSTVNAAIPPSAPTLSSESSPASEVVTHVKTTNTRVLLKVLPIKIHGPNGTFGANALIDDGSSVSLVSSALADRVGLSGRSEVMRVRGAWNGDDLVCDTTVIHVNISSADSNVFSFKARSVRELNLPTQNVSIVDYEKYSHLKKLANRLSFNNDQLKPEVLIGQDNFHLIRPLEVAYGKPGEPAATLTPLGWCVHGVVTVPHSRMPDPTIPHSTLHVSITHNDDVESELRELHDMVRRSFSIDAIGVTGKPRQNSDDVCALRKLEQTATLINGRWQVGLPWKDDHCRLPESFSMAFKRLQSVERKMAANEEFAHRYEERVSHLLVNDFAREVNNPLPTPKTWYLPHFGVDNPNKKKLRLVFDAASTSGGLSLNDHLLTGPDLLSSLFGIMIRFRENRVGVTGDIKDMFLRVKIRPEDQDSMRFLWRSKPNEPVKTFAMTSLIFGANCSPFIAQFIKNKNAQRFASTHPSAVAAICEQHYMDDYIQSLPDESTAIDMVRNITNIHSEGGFEIRNFTSNNIDVLKSVPTEALGDTAVKFKTGEQYEGERTLGLIWYPGKDELGFDVSLKRVPLGILKGEQRPTKRLLLKVVMSIFDVFGFLAPFTIQGKIMLQDTWKSNIGWDDAIPDDIFIKWRKWLELLQVIGKIRVSRCYHYAATMKNGILQQDTFATVAPNATDIKPVSSAEVSCKYNNLQLHTFSDASTKAMSAVSYWRWNDDLGNIYVALVASKCRVAPVKAITVPRLELQSALLAARLADTLLKEHNLKPTRKYFWCDSTTVLHWIKNDARNYKTFVANRLGEIDELTRASEWRYVPTKLNIADTATRESYDDTMFHNEWFHGPTFLYGDESTWPQNLVEQEVNYSILECVALVQDTSSSLPVPDPSRFSSWLRLKRATAAVLKFINKCKKLTDEADCETMERAECLLLRQAQQESFSKEVAAIKSGKSLEQDSRLRTLSPFLDDFNILRCGGRIDAASNVNLEVKRPIILDGKHHVARLLVKHYHEKAAHGQQETVVNNLKQRYWLIKLRSTVKHVATRCMVCRIRKAKPEVPRMGDLPEARLAHHQRAFTFSGCDLFGPIEVAVGRRRENRYGVLFTCLTVRAVHIEIVHSLTTDALLMALRRMAARRGWPRYLYSDNGTNLRGADTELKKAIEDLDDEVLKREAANKGVKWTFIPPASPHWGGAWERLVRSIKTSLKVILKERVPRDETLSTLLTEVENMVNSRPLTHVSVEPGSDEALTPNHFLLGASSNLPVLGQFNDSDLCLRKQWRKAQLLAEMFWKRWVREYLPVLLPRQKWTQEQKPLQVGDLVIVVDPGAQRNIWLKGVVQHVFPGADGRVRMVEIKTQSGTLRRSAARVARVPLES